MEEKKVSKKTGKEFLKEIKVRFYSGDKDILLSLEEVLKVEGQAPYIKRLIRRDLLERQYPERAQSLVEDEKVVMPGLNVGQQKRLHKLLGITVAEEYIHKAANVYAHHPNIKKFDVYQKVLEMYNNDLVSRFNWGEMLTSEQMANIGRRW